MTNTDMMITKATLGDDGVMRWRAVASDDTPDKFAESATIALYQDWLDRIEKHTQVSFLPPQDDPYLSIAHYMTHDKELQGGVAERLYIDGNRFKATGIFYDNPIGRALFDSVKQELVMTKSGTVPEHPARISAGWWDLEHTHGDFVFKRKSIDERCPICGDKPFPGKVYLSGQLDHLAVTREPVHPGTDISIMLKSEDTMNAKQKDAASLVGEEAAELLEQKSIVTKSMVEKSEAKDVPDTPPAALEIKSLADAVDALSGEGRHSSYDALALTIKSVLGNARLTSRQRLGLIEKAMNDFSGQIDDLKAAVADAYLFATDEQTPVVEKSEPAATVEKADAVAVAEAVETTETPQDDNTPNTLEATLAGFSDAIKAAMASGDRETIVADVQSSLDWVTGEIRETIEKTHPPTAADTAAEVVEKSLSGVMAQLEALSNRIDGLTQPGAVPVPAPVQKSLTAPIRQVRTTAPKAMSIRDIARRGTGLK